MKWLIFAVFWMLPVLAGCHTGMVPRSHPNEAVIATSRAVPPHPDSAHAQNVNANQGGDVNLVAYQNTRSVPTTAPAIQEAGIVTADSSPALTRAELEGIAFENNPTLVAASARIDAAIGRQIQAGLYPNPVAGFQGTEIGTQGTAGALGGFVAQRIITGRKLQLDQAIAGKDIDQARFRLFAQEQRVLSDVRIRFFEALIAQQRVNLTKELVRIGEDLVEATLTLLDGRQATENDLLQAQIRAENARILHDNAINERVEAWRRLTAVIGIPQLEMQPLDGEPEQFLPDLQWESCYQAVLEGHPELNAARAKAERANLAIARANRERVRDIDVFVSARHQAPTSDDIANVQIGMPLNLFDKNEGNIRSAEAEWIAATKEVERIELSLRDQFAVTFRRYANARQQVQRYRDQIVPKADRSLELVTEGYERGQVEYLTLLTAQQTFVEVSLAHLDALRELRVASAIIDGKLLTGSLGDNRQARESAPRSTGNSRERRGF